MNRALAKGTERVSGWADLLDAINVFPVADGDTGRNLVITLSPLLREEERPEALTERLLVAARGNSGNIAARFLSGLLRARSVDELREAAAQGRDLAWCAVPDPKPGTMLSLFDGLCEALERCPPDLSDVRFPETLLESLRDAVLETAETLPKLRRAGVVDSGALGMFLFLEGYLCALAGRHEEQLTAVSEVFGDRLRVAADAVDAEDEEKGFCVDAVLRAEAADDLQERLQEIGESVVAIEHGDRVKVHLHARDLEEVRARMGALGDLVSFASDDLQDQQEAFREARPEPVLHVVTDAAGSVTRDDARRLGFTLLESYVNIGIRSIPETRVRSEELYEAMKAGAPVSTSQASTFERHQHYDRILSLNGRALYLCVGSAFTGNHRTVTDWIRSRGREDALTVIDTGAASGRLGITALAVAERSLTAGDPDEVVRFARAAVSAAREYVFLDKLIWLARGGRLSRTKAFLGDMLSKKPVVSPMPGGAEKIAVLRDRAEQLEWAAARLEAETPSRGAFTVLLEYTDDEAWVRSLAHSLVARVRPEARILVRPFSLTSGAHMGPGTWGLSFLALPDDAEASP